MNRFDIVKIYFKSLQTDKINFENALKKSRSLKLPTYLVVCGCKNQKTTGVKYGDNISRLANFKAAITIGR